MTDSAFRVRVLSFFLALSAKLLSWRHFAPAVRLAAQRSAENIPWFCGDFLFLHASTPQWQAEHRQPTIFFRTFCCRCVTRRRRDVFSFSIFYCRHEETIPNYHNCYSNCLSSS